MDNPDQIYGAMTEGVFVAGLTAERAFDNLEALLKGDAWRSVGNGFDDVNAFLKSINLGKFQGMAEQRQRVAKRIKELQPSASNRGIAKALGVNEITVRRDGATNVAPGEENTELNQQYDATNVAPSGKSAPSLSYDDAMKAMRKAERKLGAAAETERRREASRAALPIPDGMDLRIGDCRQVLADIPDNSVPLILTDPPYGDEAEPLYEWLSMWAARVLIPGGSLVCYTGQSRLDRDMRVFSEHLRYWWLLIMPHDQSQRLPGKFVIAGFKPILWYVKANRRGRSLVPDVLKSSARDKSLHNWSQGDGGISAIVEHLTSPGELIVDPFAGTANWGRACVGMGRRWIGSDVVDGGDTVIEAAE